MSVDTSIDEGNHLINSHGLILLLLEEFCQTLATVERLLGGSVEIRAELGECSNLTVLRQEEFQRTGDLFHSLELSCGTDTGDRETDVDGRTNTLVEELSFQEDLPIGDGNDVGWDISRYISSLGLDNR